MIGSNNALTVVQRAYDGFRKERSEFSKELAKSSERQVQYMGSCAQAQQTYATQKPRLWRRHRYKVHTGAIAAVPPHNPPPPRSHRPHALGLRISPRRTVYFPPSFRPLSPAQLSAVRRVTWRTWPSIPAQWHRAAFCYSSATTKHRDKQRRDIVVRKPHQQPKKVQRRTEVNRRHSHLRDLGHERVVGVRVRQKRANRKKNLQAQLHIQNRTD
jgi:hypothetical protein